MSSAIVAAVGLALLFISAAMPTLLVVIGERRGRARAWISLGGLIALFAVSGGISTAAWITAFIGAPAMGLAYGRRKEKSVNTIFLIAFGASVLGLILIAAATAVGSGFGFGDIDAVVTTPAQHRVQTFLSHGLIQPEMLELLDKLPAELRINPALFLAFWIFIPGVYLVLASLIVWLNMVAVSRIRPAKDSPDIAGELKNWSAPESWVFTIAIPGLALVFWDNPWAVAVAGNVLAVCVMPFFFQGMAITSSTMDRFQLSPGMRMIAYALLIGLLEVVMFIPAVAVVGIMDIWLDFRRLKKPSPEKKNGSAKEDKGDRT